MSLTGRRAIVTDGASGIDYAIGTLVSVAGLLRRGLGVNSIMPAARETSVAELNSGGALPKT